MRRTLAFALSLTVALAAGLGTAVAAPTPGKVTVAPALAQNAENCLDAEEQAFLSQINAYRAQNGRPALQASAKLSNAATYHSADMADKNYFSHTLADGTTWSQNMTNFGYTANTYRGENIAAGNSGASGTFTQWKNSSGHNANMLNSNYKVIGIGRAYNANATYDWYWTTDFGGYVYSGDVAPNCSTASSSPSSSPSPSPSPSPAPTGGTAYPIKSSTRTSGSNSSTYCYDNKSNTAWITNYSSTPKTYAYVYFDLGGTKSIKSIQWMFAQTGYADSFNIQVSTNRSTWTTLATKGNATAGQWQSLSTNTSARYVRFYFTNPNKDKQLGSLAEVKITS
jgi:uncharacterized protein YkwD